MRMKLSYLRRATVLIVLSWVLSFFFLHGTYPPRTLLASDYAFLAVVAVTSFLASQPEVPWRWHLYYGFLAGLPLFIASVGLTERNYGLSHTKVNSSLLQYLLPSWPILLAVFAAGLTGGILGARLRTRKTQCEPQERQVLSESAPSASSDKPSS
jgi:hypothetical protein